MASLYFEVEAEIEGKVLPAEPDVGIFSPIIDDLDLSSVSMLVRTNKPFEPTKYRNIDLLDGLDMKARDQVIKNILAVYEREAEEEFLNDLL